MMRRQLHAYPAQGARMAQLGLVVLITVALYYALYVGGGVAPLVMRDLHMPFGYLVGSLAAANAVGAFASLLAGLADRFGRARLVVWGLLVVAGLTAFGMNLVHSRLGYGVLLVGTGFVEGIILVATPALIRDFSPQVGRATAMGFWTIGPVLGSLLTSAVNSATLAAHPDWRTQFVYCGWFCLAVWVLALVFLRELAPGLRDQLMVSERDRRLNEFRARSGALPPPARHPWRQVLRADVVASALGVSLLLLVYFTTVAFGVVYLVTVFGFSPARANALLNWAWAANAVALIGTGLWSDAVRVRKPFMLVGGLGAAGLVGYFMGPGTPAGLHPGFGVMAVVGIWIAGLMGCAYATWMASFTEAIEAIDPALTARGLAIWGWILRLVVTASFLCLPLVITTVTPLVEAAPTVEAFKRLSAAHAALPPDLVARMGGIVHAAAATAAQWQAWYFMCALGAVAFTALIFTMKGRWSPAAALADQRAHEAMVARALEQNFAPSHRPGAVANSSSGV
jgi:MFS family permease